MSKSTSIKSLQLVNFQSHAASEMTLGGPGEVTGIVGPTGNGKTALIRALRWVCHNTPEGTDMIRAGEKDCVVTVTTQSGHIVSRRRSPGGVNRYTVTDPGGATEKYEAFGRGVPAGVQEALDVRPLIVGDLAMTVNFAGQLDGPFLGNEMSASVRAKILGKLSGTEEVDHAGKNLGTDLYRRRRQLDALTAEIDALETRLQKYERLDERRQRFKELTDKLEDTKKAAVRYDEIGGIAASTEKQLAARQKAGAAVKALSWAEGYEEHFAGFMRAAGENGGLTALRAALEKAGQAAGDAEKCLRDLAWAGGQEADIPSLLDGARQLGEMISASVARRGALSAVNAACKIIAAASALIAKPLAGVEEDIAKAKTAAEMSTALKAAAAQSAKCAAVLSALDRLRQVDFQPGYDLAQKAAACVNLAGGISGAQAGQQQASLILKARALQEEDALGALGAFYEENPTCPICGNQISKETVII